MASSSEADESSCGETAVSRGNEAPGTVLHVMWVCVSRAPMSLPFIAVVAFAFDAWLSKIWNYLGFTDATILRTRFIEKEFDFIQNCDYVKSIFDRIPCTNDLANHLSPFDFELFRMLVWLASILAALRVLTGVFNLQSLDWYSESLRKRKTVSGFLAFFAMGLFGAFEAIEFHYVSKSSAAQHVLAHSPRLFLAFHAFIFCASIAFLAEAPLFVIWLAVRRNRLKIFSA
jgi:hypothetical protein